MADSNFKQCGYVKLLWFNHNNSFSNKQLKQLLYGFFLAISTWFSYSRNFKQIANYYANKTKKENGINSVSGQINHKLTMVVRTTCNDYQTILLYTLISIQYVTWFAKTRRDDAFLEIQAFASVSSIYLNLCSVAIPMLYCKYYSSYKAR